MSLCVFCGSKAFGKGCHFSSNGCHKHSTDESICMYCGTTAYGSGCHFSPSGRHEHGISRPGSVGRCRYCGSSSYGSCSLSPTRTHEH